MPIQNPKAVYPYLFLLGNCLIWYGTARIYHEIFFALLLIPMLWFSKIGRVISFVIFGCCFAEYTAIEQNSWQLPKAQLRDNHLLTGSIEGLPVHRGNITRLHFKLKTINHSAINSSKTIYVRLSCYRNCPDFQADQDWQLLVRLKEPNGYINPSGFDYEKWLYAEQFKATGYIVLSKQNQLLATQNGINSLREYIRQYFVKNITIPELVGSAIALGLGDSSYLTSEQKKQLAGSGLSHLMAISGLHIGLSAIPGFILAGLLWRRIRVFQRFNRIQFQWLLCIIPAICYTALSGFGLPAWRALIMLLVFALTQLGRQSISTHSRFGLALWFILLTQPLAPLQISFWLSFCATAILIFLSQLPQSKNSVLTLIRLQSQLFILLMPIQLLIFGTISFISPLLNFVAIPFVSFLLLPLLLILVIMIIFSLPGTEYAMWIVEQLLHIFWLVLKFFTPFAEASKVTNLTMNYWYLLVYPLLILLLVPLKLYVKAVIIAVIFSLQISTKKSTLFRMIVLDVGQGLAITVDYQDKLLVYDTAYGSADFAVAEMTLLPWIKTLAADQVDLLIVGHDDADHSGGLEQILKSIPINEMLIGPDVNVPSSLSHKAKSINRCNGERRWQWYRLTIESISPHSLSKLEEGNDTSCVLLLTIHGVKILLTGDIEVDAEKQLIEYYPKLKADILLAPHHGSKTSSSENLLQNIKPKVALISSGYLNRFGFPHKSVVERYERQSVRILNTAYSGAIEVTINEQGVVAIKEWRLANLTLWRRH